MHQEPEWCILTHRKLQRFMIQGRGTKKKKKKSLQTPKKLTSCVAERKIPVVIGRQGTTINQWIEKLQGVWIIS